jgi:hypothetical protein
MKHKIMNFLKKKKKKPGFDFTEAPDERQRGKVTHQKDDLLNAMFLGFVSNKPTLRDVEEMTRDLRLEFRAFVPKPISDTTLDTAARELSVEYLTCKLVQQVREDFRSKMLNPVGLPCGVATVDGKNLATLPHAAEGAGHARTKENEKWQNGKGEYFLFPALRASLTSAESRPVIYQQALLPKTGESSQFRAFVDELHMAFGRSGMFGVIDGDAGLTSLANADHVDSMGYAYIFGLKGNQKDLYEEARFILEEKARNETPEALTPWEKRGASDMRRKLWRTNEMVGIENTIGTWRHLRQTWLVRQETRQPDGSVEVEDRYFITSMLWNYFSPMQILTEVRGHWRVENDCFNSLDLQWREDSAPWCTQENAIFGLSLLRTMAYNVVQQLRRRRLCRKDENGLREKPMSWRSLFKYIMLTIETADTCQREIAVAVN